MQKLGQKVIVLLIMGAFLSGCATVQVSQDYDPQGVATHHGTWYWEDASQPQSGDLRVDNPLLNSRIRRAIRIHLTTRGIPQKQAQPDLFISYRLVIQPKLRGYANDFTLGWGGFYSPWHWGVDTSTRIEQYDECQLTIDIKAAGTGALLWRGTGVYLYRTYGTPDSAFEAMQRTVDRILSQFPPEG